MVNEPATSTAIQIKGVREGLLITLSEGEWETQRATLIKHIDERLSFFKGAKVALDVGNQTLRAVELGNLRDVLSDRGISLWAVISNSPMTEQTAQVLGMATRLSAPRAGRATKSQEPSASGETVVFVQRTMRSGLKVTFEGHVVVMGDVNPGAEIIAGGNIIVWGKLRGSVHAGAEGNENAVVCALEMSPALVRIATVIEESSRKRGKSQPEIAHLKNGQIIIEPWNK